MDKIHKHFKAAAFLLTLLTLAAVSGCYYDRDPILGGGGDVEDVPQTTVTAVTPLNKATSVAINIKLITAAFSKEMDPASLDTSSFTLEYNNIAVPSTTVTYVVTGSVVTLTLPAANLKPNTLYTATITNDATAVDGISLSSDFVWSFTTGSSADLTAPTVISTSAYGITGDVSGAIDLPINRSSAATFSEPMDPLSITTVPALTVVNTTLGGTAVAGTVTYDVASKTVTFKPTVDLAALTLYTSTIDTNAKDLAGNALVVDYVWSWTTGALADTDRPKVLSTVPLDAANNVLLNQTINATFNEDMDPITISTLSFTVVKTGFPVVTGLVTYDPLTRIATLAPLVDLEPSTTYKAKVTTVATDLAGNQLEGNQPPVPPAASNYEWSFTTGTAIIPAANLGVAASFGMASTKGVTNTGATLINGDVVLNPNFTCNAVSADNLGGFGLCGGGAPTINGEVITPLYPDTVTAQTITLALRAAYLEITPANMPGGTPLAAPTTMGAPMGNVGVLGDNLFYPGVYQSGTSIFITGDLTLDAQGDANATFVFQSGETVDTAPGTRILLINGAKSSNVWWQAGSDATLGTNTTWHGNILAYRDVTMNTGTTSCGRLFAGAFTDGAFVFDSNTVSVPGNPNAPVGCE